MKVKKLDSSKGPIFQFKCPACKVDHAVDGTWNFNGDFEKPTFSPSVLYKEFDEAGPVYICHFYIRDGVIDYLNDCSHVLKGDKIPMEDL